MTRYDWPALPRTGDDPVARASHNGRLRPPMDVASIVEQPTSRRRRSGRVVPHNAPVGNQHLWFPMGPSVMTNGQATGAPDVTGRIRDLQVEPVAGLRVYAASASGGTWFSPDRGQSWTPLDEWQESPDRADIGTVANALSCGALHVVWGGAADGSLDEVWIGTGELTGGADAGPGGFVAGIGFLTTGPASSGGLVVAKGGPLSADPDSLRGRTVSRITGDPGSTRQLFAATSNGLYFRPPPAGDWTRVGSWTSGTPIDVVLTRPAVDRVRIWVAERSALWVAESTGPATTPIDPAALTFIAVPLPGVHSDPTAVWPVSRKTRLALAASADGARLYVLGRRGKTAAETRTHPPAQLWSVDATAMLASMPTAATKLAGTPLDLFGTDNDQSDYDMCIAAHPTVVGRVYLGGSIALISGVWNAALHRCETTATAVTPTLIGDGVHGDVHTLRLGPPGPDPARRTLWVGCDGGIFRSDADGDPSTFQPTHDGLAVLQPGYVASHPTNAGIVAAGFQDNGTAERTGDTVWRQRFAGDGGGTVYDPGHPGRYFRQYVQATWQSNDAGAVPPVHRRSGAAGSAVRSSEKTEAKSALFYSGADATLHGGLTHLGLGTNRVWYSIDWGRSWVTLPTGTDPRAGTGADLAQDVIASLPLASNATPGSLDCCGAPTGVPQGSILTVKFAKPADVGGNHRIRALVLQGGGLVWMFGTRSATGAGAFTWTRPTATLPLAAQSFRAPRPGAEMTTFTNGDPLRFLPAPDQVSDVAVHDPDAGLVGSCYVSTIGSTPFAAGTPGARHDTLWFFDGTDTWVPTGLRTQNPRGTWADPASRVTAPALGVVVDPADLSRVYVATSVGVVCGTLTVTTDGSGARTYAWQWEQFMNGLPEAAVHDLSIHRFDAPTGPPGARSVRLLRAALQSRGVWETDLGNVVAAPLTYLRLYPTDTRRRLPTPLSGPTVAGEAEPPRWDRSPDVVVDTTGLVPTRPLTEVRLASLATPGPPGVRASVSFAARDPVVHVLVHQRWSAAALPGDVRVVLVRHALPASGVVPLGGLWPALVTAAGAAAPPATPLPDGWEVAGPALWQSPSAPVDVRMPRVVSFTVDLSSVAANSDHVLLAVVLSASNQITPADLANPPGGDATTVDQLVASSPHAAARSVLVL